MANIPQSTLIDSTGDPLVGGALKDGVTNAWSGVLPSGTRSDVVLEQKQCVLAIPQENATILALGGKWGSMEGDVVLYVCHPPGKSSNFAVVTSVSTLDAGDIFEDAKVAAEVNAHVSGATANLCVFLAWPGIDAATVGTIASILPDATKALQVVQDVDTALAISSTSKQTGIGLSVSFSLTNPDPKCSASLLRRLGDIYQLSSAISAPTLLMGCTVAKASVPDSNPVSSIVFTSTLNVLPILDDALFKDISLSLSITRSPDPSSPTSTVLTLRGDFVLAMFDARAPWVSTAFLVIDNVNHFARLTVEPAPSQTQDMLELGAFKLSNVNFHATYTFGPSVNCNVSLSVDVTVGSKVFQGAVAFSGTRQTVLQFALSGTLDITGLFHAIFPNQCPDNLPELSLGQLAFTYAWKSASDASRGQQTPGLTATALADILGIRFNAAVKFDASNKDISASGQILAPLDLTIVTLHGANNVSSGPLITYDSTQTNGKNMTIDGGLTILGLQFPQVQIVYAKSVKDQQPCLQVDVVLNSTVFPGGSVTANLEFVKINNKTHVRLNGIPLTEIKEAFNEKQLVDKIRDLTSQDPCKAIDIQSSDILTSTWLPKIEFSEKQPTPKLGEPLQCSFDISCTWTLTLLKEKSVTVDMKPFPLIMNVPQSWVDLWKQIGIAIANSIDSIVQDLLDNVDKFSEIISFYAAKYAAEEWMKNALRAWLCRHKNAPVPNPDPVTTPPTPTTDNPSPGSIVVQVGTDVAVGVGTASTVVELITDILGVASCVV